MKTSLLFYILLIFYTIFGKSQVISDLIHITHGGHSINYYPQKEVSTFSCTNRIYILTHPYANDCRKYLECYNGNLFQKTCEPGTAFDKDRRFCDHKHKVNCDYWNTTNQHIPQSSSKEITDSLCPSGTLGTYPYYFNHFYYLECRETKTLIQNCPYGMKYNITQRKCITVDLPQPEQPNKNDDQYKYLHKCPTQDKQKYFYSFNASKYIQCSRGELKVLDCGHLEVFSISQKTCLSEILVPHYDHVHIQTPIDTRVPAKHDYIIYCPMDLFGLYPHPFSNEKYLKCVDGRLYNESCGTGFVYDIFSKFCEKNLTSFFATLPPIQRNYTADSKIETRLNDSLTFLKCPADLHGTFIHPFYCNKYINCSSAGTNLATCSTGEIYSFRKGKCLIQSELDGNDHVVCKQINDNAPTEESIFHSLGVYCASKGTMKYPHPKSWYKYILCNNGKVKVEFCPRNMVFNLEISECIDETKAMEII